MILQLKATRQNQRDPLGMVRVLRVMHGSLSRRQPLKLMFAAVGGKTGLYMQASPRIGPHLAKQVYGEYPDCELIDVDPTTLALPEGYTTIERSLTLSPDLFPITNFLQHADSDRKFSDPLPAILEALGHQNTDV